MVSTVLLLPIQKVKVVMTVSLSVLMYLTKLSWKDFQLPLNKVIQNQVAIEEKILVSTYKNSTGKSDEKDFCKKLVTWADVIRKTYFDGGVDEIISTRRLVHIIQAYAIFGKKMKAVEVCTNRFDDDTKNSFIELYTKVDAGATAEQISEEARQADITSQMDDNDSESDDDSAI